MRGLTSYSGLKAIRDLTCDNIAFTVTLGRAIPAWAPSPGLEIAWSIGISGAFLASCGC